MFFSTVLLNWRILSFQPLHQFLLIGLQIFLGMLKFFHLAVEICIHLLFKCIINRLGDKTHRTCRKRTFARTIGYIC